MSDNKNINTRKFLGYKFFKQIDDNTFDIIRIVNTYNSTEIVKVQKEDGVTYKTTIKSLKDYTPLEPFGIVSFNKICTYVYKDKITNKKDPVDKLYDVMVMMYTNMNVKFGDKLPFAVCRQSVNDFFADLLYNDPKDNNNVGVCVTRENCPANLEFMELLSCDELIDSDIVHIYKDDNINTILNCINISKYDKVLNNLYEEHAKTNTKALLKDIDQGWCRHLKDLLVINNFMVDFNTMCNVTGFDFDLSKYLNTRDNGIKELNDIALLFFDEVFKVNATQTRVTEFNYSIDMSKFNNTSYCIIRDSTNKLYLVVYLEEGEYLEEELQKKIAERELSVTEKLRLSYYEKFGK